MLFFRIFQHLLPDAAAWRLTVTKTLRKFFEGLSGPPEDAREFVDLVFEDAFPATTRELAEWEKQFGLEANPVEATRRLNLAAEWAAGGGQSPSYIQGVLQTAGFALYVHEWWESGPPYVARDPRLYTRRPFIGSYQCTGYDGAGDPLADQPQCTGYSPLGLPLADQPQCNRFLANDPGYLVNKDLTPRAPPPVPDDPQYWPYFLYIGAETFPNLANVDNTRRAELERLLLKICPTQHWIVLLVTYVAPGAAFADEDGFGLLGFVSIAENAISEV